MSGCFPSLGSNILTRISGLEGELSKFRERSARLEEQCHGLHDRVLHLEDGRRGLQAQHAALAAELREQIKSLTERLNTSSREGRIHEGRAPATGNGDVVVVQGGSIVVLGGDVRRSSIEQDVGSQRHIQFNRDTNVIEVPSGAAAQFRSSKSRVPTQHIHRGIRHGISFAEGEQTIQYQDELGSEQQALRSAKARTPTAFVSGTPDVDISDRSVVFDGNNEVIEVEDTTVSMARSSKQRVPTAYIAPQADGNVRFAEETEEIEEDGYSLNAEASSGVKARPIKNRQATAFVREVVPAGSRVVICDDAETVEIPDSTDGAPRRSAKSRTPTAFAPATSSSAGVRFDGPVEEIESEQSSNHASAPARSAKGRQATAFVKPSAAESRSVGFRDRDSVLEVESSDGTPDQRSVKGRVPTAFAPFAPADVKSVVRFDDESEEIHNGQVEPSGQMRAVKGRQQTSFVAKTELPASESSRQVGFRERDSIVEMEEDQTTATRSAKSRTPTAFVKDSAEDRAGPSVCFQDQSDQVVEIEQEDGGQMRETKSRKPTAFVQRLPPADDDQKRVVISGRASVVEIDNDIEDDHDAPAMRSAKNRVATAFVPSSSQKQGERQVVICNRESVVEIEGDSVGRNVKNRKPTSFHREKDDKPSVRFADVGDDDSETPSSPPKRVRIPTKFVPVQRRNSVKFADCDSGKEDESCSEKESEAAEDVDSADSNGEHQVRARPSRTRVPTKFVHADGKVAGSDVAKKLELPEGAISRPSRARLPTTFARGSVCSVADDAPPAGSSSATAETEGAEASCNRAYIDRHSVTGLQKDKESIRNTLKSLDFFHDLDDEACDGIIQAMGVFRFEDGEDVTRQGNTNGSHFFIVAEGTFAVFLDGELRNQIKKGAAFGESVVLMSGAQRATVRAQGTALVYGMRGMDVRSLMQKQYREKNKEVIQAVDEVLASGGKLFAKLTPYQVQCLYDRATVGNFKDGEIVVNEGQPGPVHVLLKGSLQLSIRGTQRYRAAKFDFVGDASLFCDKHSERAAAIGDVETLALSRELLQDMFGDKLKKILTKERVHRALSSNKAFSSLTSEIFESMTGLYQVYEVEAGKELEQKDNRLAVCLQGELEIEGPDKNRHPYIQGDVVGAEQVVEGKGAWTLRCRATNSAAPVHLAIWVGNVLDVVLANHGFEQVADSAVDDNMEESETPTSCRSWRSHSPSMQLAVLREDKVGALKKVVVFRSLSKSQLAQLANALQVQHATVGEMIFSQGEDGKEFFIIHKGAVEIILNGKRVRTLGIGDYVGERALLFSDRRSATVKAIEECELWKMGKDEFMDILQGPIIDYMKDRIAFQNTKVELDDLNCLRVVGRGGFGVVKMVQHKTTGVRYALKCVSKEQAVKQRQQWALAVERSILAELDHPFVIKFVRSFRGSLYVYFLMELVTGGEMLDALDQLGLLKLEQAQFYAGSIVLALEFLHERRIAYLDLKGENCLVDQHGYIKIIDFGVAERIKNGRCHVVKGTPLFMAPEVILGKGYTTSADLWSLGVCVYDFMVGQFPFANDSASNAAVFRAVLKAALRFPKWFREEVAIDIIQGLLSRDPGTRLGARNEGYKELKEHSFFEGFSWDGLLGRQLIPPFRPKAETYAEDQDASSSKEMVSEDPHCTTPGAGHRAPRDETDDNAWEEEF